MSIKLAGIAALGDNRYRLDFQDGTAGVSFVLEVLSRRRVVISREFDRYFDGRSSASEAIDALSSFADGEDVSFPVEVLEDGFTGMGR